RGTVNGYEPILNGSPISGVGADGKMRSGGPPCLSDDAKFDKYGRCYVCIKIKVDPKTGKMKLPPTEDDLTVKITDKPRLGESDKYWLHPIAIFTKDGRMGQVAYFDYLHYTSRHPANLLEGPTGDFKFHYFCVA
ncbi:MAG: hypothetical protein EBU33_01570, partial [Sphingobacteriia bacterium]|nr:hypothetical protein [Sphingobacteriia bacterium]